MFMYIKKFEKIRRKKVFLDGTYEEKTKREALNKKIEKK